MDYVEIIYYNNKRTNKEKERESVKQHLTVTEDEMWRTFNMIKVYCSSVKNSQFRRCEGEDT